MAVFGGSIGAWGGMKVWHHKTMHKKLAIAFFRRDSAKFKQLVFALAAPSVQVWCATNPPTASGIDHISAYKIWHKMKELLLIFIGGGTGSVLRYLAGRCIGSSAFPWGMFTVNIIGCFLIGLLGTWIARQYCPK